MNHDTISKREQTSAKKFCRSESHFQGGEIYNINRVFENMSNWYKLFTSFDIRLANWMARYGVAILRVTLGIVFFWFGVLKFFPGLSPAQDLAIRTIHILTFDLIPGNITIILLATWECLIGIGLIFNLFMRATLFLLWLQMLGTITPIFFFPFEIFTHIPYVPTLEGQYIIKNLVLISAGLVIGATVRGGRLVADSNRESWS